jgi:hypothetical protein
LNIMRRMKSTSKSVLATSATMWLPVSRNVGTAEQLLGRSAPNVTRSRNSPESTYGAHPAEDAIESMWPPSSAADLL